MSAVIISVLMLVATIALGQDQLNQTEHTVVPQVEMTIPGSPMHTELPRSSGIFGELSCDRSGAIYLRPDRGNPDARMPLNAAVVRINSDGTVNKFAANQENGMVAPHVLDDAIDADGHVYLLTMRPGKGQQLTVLQLSADSSYLSKTDLDRELTPNLFTVMPSGDFLIGGNVTEKQDKPDTQPTTKSVLWLFGNDGRFKRDFLSTEQTSGKSSKTKKKVDAGPRNLTALQIGDDGNLYVLEPSISPTVLVFDQDGKKVRTLTLQAPSQGVANRKLYISNGRLMVPYWTMIEENGKRIGKRVFRVYDSQTGIASADYVAAFQGVLACMDNNDLIFLTNGADGQISVSRASMR